MIFEVQILGSNSALADHGRHPTSQVVRFHHHHFLIDCGEGTQLRMQHFKIKRFKISHIFISHLHGDHYFGLIGLLTTFQLLRRNTPLTIVAPPNLEPIIRLQLEAGNTQLNYPLHFIYTQDKEKEVVFEDEWIKVSSFPLAHRIACTGFLFEEKSCPRRINSEAIKGLNLSSKHYEELKYGIDIIDNDGISHSNESLTFNPFKQRKYAYCSDTKFLPSLKDIIQGVDLLYHEATFMQDAEARAEETGHSTTIQAATQALQSEVKHLIIGHFSSKYIQLSPLLTESQSVFEETSLAIEGTVFQIDRKTV